MTAIAKRLVDEVAAAGGRLAICGEKLDVSAPAPLPDVLIDRLRENKPAVIQLMTVSDWGPQMADAVEWFLGSTPPPAPFGLHKGVTVLDARNYWRAIRADIAAGPQGPRARYGAVQGDLARLFEQFGGAEP